MYISQISSEQGHELLLATTKTSWNNKCTTFKHQSAYISCPDLKFMEVQNEAILSKNT